MHSRLLRLVGGSTVWMLGACGAQPTEVELRLYPCDLMSGAPTSVSLRIQSYGADGAIGEPLSKTFPIADQDVFADKFATVGFTPPAGTLSADITVTWIAADEMVQAVYNEAVPALGEALELGKDECEGAPDSTTTPTTIDPTTAGPGTSETGTSTETGTTTSTDPTETTSTSTSTTETTSTSTTDETTTTTSTTDTTDTTMGTSGGPMEGDDCPVHNTAVCDAGPGVLGKVLHCQVNKWVVNNGLCSADSCGETGFANPQVAGCVGTLESWYCACADTPKSECSMGMQSQCGEATGDGVKVELCIEDAGQTYHYVSVCPNCEEVDGEPLCLLR
ncbi:hypothetical protein OV203_15295 [Nannocystis sp. ILAH1]|uniref:hypothetical protein n=1 Tax=unclassified Nannocystis TaxID=2627009 RepID=UPI00227039E1|nr:MULTISPECIES: hypothetical protein [unclassified Nannocystis]MCY0988496.1 hypothetical protein [Nannocystis sp. ILAH1]MCY1067542.1 hypothetical protein [Nannocystis sp. RBIL2]